MKNTIATFAALSCAFCLMAYVPRAESRGIRVDQPNFTPCELTNWNPNSDPYAGQASFNPGGISVGTSTATDTVVACGSGTDNTADGGSFFNVNGTPAYNESYAASLSAGAANAATYLATSGEMYQFESTTNFNGNNPYGSVDASVIVWSLKGGDTEIELNSWCSSGSTGASFTWGKNIFSGGCGSQTNDLLFNKSGALIGYVNDLANFNTGGPLVLVTPTPASVPAGWSETPISPTTAPEIDPSSAIAALTLLLGSLAVLRGGRRDN
jgi:hypothetical protein